MTPRHAVLLLLVPAVLDAAPARQKGPTPASPAAAPSEAPRFLAEARAASAAGDDAKASQVLARFATGAPAKDPLAPLVQLAAREYASRVAWQNADAADAPAARALLASDLFPPAEVQGFPLDDARVQALFSRLRAADPHAAKLFGSRSVHLEATVAPGLPADLGRIVENELAGSLHALGMTATKERNPESLQLAVAPAESKDLESNVGGLSVCTVTIDVRWTDATGPVLPEPIALKQSNVALGADEACRRAAVALARDVPLAVVRAYLGESKKPISR